MNNITHTNPNNSEYMNITCMHVMPRHGNKSIYHVYNVSTCTKM